MTVTVALLQTFLILLVHLFHKFLDFSQFFLGYSSVTVEKIPTTKKEKKIR